MSAIVPIIVIAIIALQIYFFRKNRVRMQEYRDIFEEDTSWGIEHDPETGFVSGIKGRGNGTFDSIKESINKYLRSNAGSVIDFHLLKDAVDRHCDSVENDINTLTPVPLYCGLAGTMVGVIVGLSSLLYTGSITALLSSGSGDFGTAANGVNDLLSGVAWAMIASICGIFFTTLGSILFKRYKLDGEYGKNTFLAWLQSKLLPELPSDTSDALNRLVVNLNRFNETFAENTSELRGALQNVNESYRIQADIIQAVHDMDIMQMANANVKVLKELQQCTEKLEQFNEYLSSVQGYTEQINEFTSTFQDLQVLRELKSYFENHKAEIARYSADADRRIREAFEQINTSAQEGSAELSTTLTRQATEFKQIINEQKETFERINEDLETQFGTQLRQMPALERKLSEISEIPGRLDQLIRKIEASNTALATSVAQTTKQAVGKMASQAPVAGMTGTVQAQASTPRWMRWTILVAVVLMAAACITNTVHNILVTDRPAMVESETTAIDSAAQDTTFVVRDSI